MLRLCKYKGPIRTSWKALLRKIALHAAQELIGGEIKSRHSFCHDRQALDGVRCPEAGIPEVVAAAELESRLPATLAALEAKFGPETRAVLELRALGRPWEEISKALDIPLRSCSFKFCKAEDWVRKELSLPPRKGDDHE